MRLFTDSFYENQTKCRCSVRGYDLTDSKRVKILDLLQNRFRIFSYDRNEIRAFCKSLSKAKYIEVIHQ